VLGRKALAWTVLMLGTSDLDANCPPAGGGMRPSITPQMANLIALSNRKSFLCIPPIWIHGLGGIKTDRSIVLTAGWDQNLSKNLE
jgi:hypothetical protein